MDGQSCWSPSSHGDGHPQLNSKMSNTRIAGTMNNHSASDHPPGTPYPFVSSLHPRHTNGGLTLARDLQCTCGAGDSRRKPLDPDLSPVPSLAGSLSKLKFMDESASSSSPGSSPGSEGKHSIASPATSATLTPTATSQYSPSSAPLLCQPCILARSEETLASSQDNIADYNEDFRAPPSPPTPLPPPPPSLCLKSEADDGQLSDRLRPTLHSSRFLQGSHMSYPQCVTSLSSSHTDAIWTDDDSGEFLTPVFNSVGHSMPSLRISGSHIIHEDELKYSDHNERDCLQPSPPQHSPVISHENSPQSRSPRLAWNGSGDREGGYLAVEDCSDTESLAESIYHQPPKAADRSAAHRLAKRLYSLEGFKITDVAKHLSKRNDFSQLVGEEFASFFDLKDIKLDEALRIFLSKFTLTGETQERERVLHHFSRRFIHCNPTVYNSEDACHTLVCALMLLNTDLHGQNVPRKMTCQDFIANLAELNNGDNFNREDLKYLYNSIKNDPIHWPHDDQLAGIISIAKPQMNDATKRLLGATINPFLDVPSETNAKEYMRGFLLRKWVMESYGHKASLGKRGWKMFYARLRDMVIYLHKDAESAAAASRAEDAAAAIASVESQALEGSVTNPSLETEVTDQSNGGPPVSKDTAPTTVPQAEAIIRVAHALAMRATDYSKKQNVFRLKTKEGSEYLFQASDPKEVDLWVDSVNFVAALLSAPPMASGVGSEKSFYRPLLPVCYTKCNIKEQLEEHQKRILDLDRDLVEHKKNPPKKSSRAKVKAEYEEKLKYLEEEVTRYKIYARLLEVEITQMQNVFASHYLPIAPQQPVLMFRPQAYPPPAYIHPQQMLQYQQYYQPHRVMHPQPQLPQTAPSPPAYLFPGNVMISELSEDDSALSSTNGGSTATGSNDRCQDNLLNPSTAGDSSTNGSRGSQSGLPPGFYPQSRGDVYEIL